MAAEERARNLARSARPAELRLFGSALCTVCGYWRAFCSYPSFLLAFDFAP
jgi:hypothetical protein